MRRWYVRQTIPVIQSYSKTCMHTMINTSEIAKWRSQHMYFINQNQMNKKIKKKSRRQEAETRWEIIKQYPSQLKLKRKKHAFVMTTQEITWWWVRSSTLQLAWISWTWERALKKFSFRSSSLRAFIYTGNIPLAFIHAVSTYFV